MESALREGSGQPGLTLIETLRWEGGPNGALVRGDRHLARLARGAAALGWPCDGPAAQTALAQAAQAALAAQGHGPLRLRLTLDRDGALAGTAAPLPATAPLWRLGPAPGRLTSTDPWLRLKSSRRGHYDAARAALPDGIDEVIFLNESGQVCDGTITTLFFDRGRGLRSPPLSAGLLPGILREELLEQDCREEPLAASDLPRVRLWVGNSLRGLIPAVWTG